MSRVGKKPIDVPERVEVSVQNREMEVKGPKGSLRRVLPPLVEVEYSEGRLVVATTEGGRSARAMHGLARALIANMVSGVSEGFQKVLQVIGVGYRAATEGNHLVLELGYSHPVRFPVPDGITITVEKNTLITVTGIDKQLVGDVAAKIRSFRPPEPYKGKGVRYRNEYVRRKEGKRNV